MYLIHGIVVVRKQWMVMITGDHAITENTVKWKRENYFCMVNQCLTRT